MGSVTPATVVVTRAIAAGVANAPVAGSVNAVGVENNVRGIYQGGFAVGPGEEEGSEDEEREERCEHRGYYFGEFLI